MKKKDTEEIEYFVVGKSTPQFRGDEEEHYHAYGMGGRDMRIGERSKFTKTLAEKRKLLPHLGGIKGYPKLSGAKQLAGRKCHNLNPMNIVGVRTSDGLIRVQFEWKGGIIYLD